MLAVVVVVAVVVGRCCCCCWPLLLLAVVVVVYDVRTRLMAIGLVRSILTPSVLGLLRTTQPSPQRAVVLARAAVIAVQQRLRFTSKFSRRHPCSSDEQK